MAQGRAVREVLRRAAEHRRAADVDHLHGFLLADAVPTRDLAERIEVHADEVERLDVMFRERGSICIVIAAREDRGVDPWVQRLHTAAEHLGDTGQLLDAVDVDADLLLEVVGRAAAGDDVPPELREPAGEFFEPGLVVDGDQRAQSSCTTSGRSRCSTS
jgi:hypothetical protein